MNYGELRTEFLDNLNRTDCTDAQADKFITMGLRRVERLLRTPLQRVTTTTTTDASFDGKISIPSDYLGVYEVRCDGNPVYRISTGQKEEMEGFYVEGANFVFNGTIPEGSVMEVEYYNEFGPAASDAATTTYSLVIPDITTYAALVFAAIHFVDERQGTFEGLLTTLVTEAQMMADIEEMSGGLSIKPQGGGIV